MPKTVPTKLFDWTYTTLYPGHAEPSSTESVAWQPADRNNPKHTIPLAELTRQDPILFYAEIPLYEDELHDNGASHLLVRIVRLSREACCVSLISVPSACYAYMHLHSAAVHAQG